MDDRLTSIANFVPNGSTIVDVGTDHGYLAIELIKNGIAKFAIASDKNIGPLEAAKKNIKAAGISNKIDIRLGDGLKVVKVSEVNVICIAGMGGSLICDILSNSIDVVNSVDKIILQPMNSVDKVHQWIKSNGWNIEDEELAEVDGIIYEIICASRNFDTITSTKKMKSPLLPKLIKNKIDKLQRVIDTMDKSPTAKTSDKYFEIKNQIEKLRESLQ